MVAIGPLAVRFHGCSVGAVRAGALTSVEVELENAGSVEWHSRDAAGVQLSYHWLDDLGNPIVWDGLRTALASGVPPGARLRASLRVRGPMPPGRYRLAVDLVDEGRAWFGELGNEALELDQEVAPRIARALAARGGDAGALAAQEEPLVPADEADAVAYLADGCAPAPDWSRRVLDAHQEGYALVGGSILAPGGLLGRKPKELSPGRRAAAACRASPIRSCAPRSSPAPSRRGSTPSPGFRPPALRRASRGSTTAASSSGQEGVAGRARARAPDPIYSSTAIRSSARLKTQAPSASASAAATHR